jgi:predicted Rossmann fold flavoprotein
MRNLNIDLLHIVLLSLFQQQSKSAKNIIFASELKKFADLKDIDTIIIGAGPAGLSAAIHLKIPGIIVLEKNASPGKKLLISGTGQCNYTHDGDINEFLNHYGDNAKFLKTALRSFTNRNLSDYFLQNGIQSVTDKNGKIFPESLNANDILQMLISVCLKKGIHIYAENSVVSVEKNERGFDIKTNNNRYSSKRLIISTGGLSYPGTGSTGDGYHFARELGHTIVKPKPALSPVYIRDYRMSELAGVSLQDVAIYIYRDNKKIRAHRGDIGFTHKGLSGPGILDFSRHIENNDILKLNLIGENAEDFRKVIIETSHRDGKQTLQLLLRKYLIPRSLIKIILLHLNIEPDLNLASVSKEMRNQLVNAFCEYPFKIEKVGGFKVAMTTRGGVSLNEINSKTMESKLVKNLFFAGEVMDIDGDTGGYNIQAAFSTGYLAASAINPVIG